MLIDSGNNFLLPTKLKGIYKLEGFDARGQGGTNFLLIYHNTLADLSDRRPMSGCVRGPVQAMQAPVHVKDAGSNGNIP